MNTGTFWEAIRTGNVEDAIWTAKQLAQLAGKRSIAKVAAALLAMPSIQQRLQQVVQGIGLNPISGTPFCQVFAARVFGALQQLGMTEKVQVYLIQPAQGTINVARPVAEFGYHYCIRFGNTVVDSLTGTGGEAFSSWIQRFSTQGVPFDRAYMVRDETGAFQQWLQGVAPTGLPGF